MYARPCWDVDKITHKQKHTHLNSLIEALETRLKSSEPANRSLVSLLNSLAAHLEMHFELEKPDKNFTTTALGNSRFVYEIQRLEREREAILCDVDDMIDMARLAFKEKRDIQPLAKRYFAFQGRFAEHEAAEKKLLQEVFSAHPVLDN
ncbi:MAG: hypothetical protein SH868_15040 [Bythopirellula sp.]|nr:hypothetical protein [Bythopirellula sp.]